MSTLAYAVYSLLAIGLLILLVRRWSVLILVLYYCLHSTLTVIAPDTLEQDPTWKVYRLFYVFLIVASGLHILGAKRSGFSPRRLALIPYFCVILVILVSALYTPPHVVHEWETGLGLLERLVAIALYWLSAAQFQKQRDLLCFVGGTVLTCVVLSVWVIWTASLSGFFAPRAGLEVNPNYVAGFIAVGAIPLIDLCFLRGRRFARMLAVVAILVALYAIYLAGSRGATLALSAATALIVCRRVQLRGYWQTTLSFLALALLSVAVFTLPGSENVRDRIASPSATSASIEYRMSILWPRLVQQLLDRDWAQTFIGEGLNSSGVFLFEMAPATANAHNMYLEWLYDQGLVGLALLLWFLYSVRKRIPKAPHAYVNIFYGWYIYFLVAGLVSGESNGILFWILIGVSVGGYAISERNVSFGKRAIEPAYAAAPLYTRFPRRAIPTAVSSQAMLRPSKERLGFTK